MTLADKLKPYVPAIIDAADSGNAGARQIIQLYRLHCACPSDPGAPALCEAALDDWIKSTQVKSTRGST